ncbi:MAG TPA: S41 family peptidase, partial [Trueperaceae bacterium]
MRRGSHVMLCLLSLAAFGAAQPATDQEAPAARRDLAAHAASADQGAREVVFEATVDLFIDYYWDPNRLDWEAWADRHRAAAAAARSRGQFDSVMRRMIEEVGDDHSRWLGLSRLDPALTPITPPFEPAEPSGQLPDEAPGPWAQADETPSLGMLVRWVAGAGVVIDRVLPDTPADEAGLRRGDVITRVGETDLEEVGAAGVGFVLTSSLEDRNVDLTVKRNGRETISLSLAPRYLVQAELRRTASAVMLEDGVGYVYVPSFTLSGTGERIHRLLAGLRSQGATSYVLDLRGNGGGSLAELGVMMGAFVDGEWASAEARGQVVWTAEFERAAGDGVGVAVLREVNGRVLRAATIEQPIYVTEPLIVLVDEGTSSAAEVAASILQATGRARVVGVLTSGNVEVVRTYLLPDQSQVLVAV